MQYLDLHVLHNIFCGPPTLFHKAGTYISGNCVIKLIWRERKVVRSPAEFICYACSFMSYWAGLKNEGVHLALEREAKTLQNVVLGMHDEREVGLGRDTLMLGARRPLDDEMKLEKMVVLKAEAMKEDNRERLMLMLMNAGVMVEIHSCVISIASLFVFPLHFAASDACVKRDGAMCWAPGTCILSSRTFFSS